MLIFIKIKLKNDYLKLIFIKKLKNNVKIKNTKKIDFQKNF